MMDHLTDYERFKRLVMRLCVTFEKFASEEILETWWKVLRREPYQLVERGIEAFIARADDKTKFPKPGQFAGCANTEAAAGRAAVASERAWQEFCDRFPTTGPLRRKLAHANAILASEPQHTPAYAEAQSEMLALERLLGPQGRFSADA